MNYLSLDIHEKKIGKELYGYQSQAIKQIFDRLHVHPENYNLLYQLPTGGGKTVIFSEIAKKYICETGKKVLILTHRIELSRQTSNMLTEFGVPNKVIDSKVKQLEPEDTQMCFVAMVETLNNRLQDEMIEINNVGLVIVDEAHYNSFRKLFKYFEKPIIVGVTATPLSSNIQLPMYENYNELIVGNSIADLIQQGFLSKASTYCYDVGLGKLKVGMNGDYTVRSSDLIYTDFMMGDKLLYGYKEKAKGTKTLIFNNGINTSKFVLETFTKAGYDIKHLDNTNNETERREILQWFKEKPDAILTSVGILTTGFDEPTVETIILNRATRSLTLYHQMIGRGSRVLPDKNSFQVIDLGNNAARFGMWEDEVDWEHIFKFPDFYLENITSDDEIERHFKYTMPDELRARFEKSDNIEFDVKEEFEKAKLKGLRSSKVIDMSIEQHSSMCINNACDLSERRHLARLLEPDISDRIRRYSYCIAKSTDNYIKWLQEEYIRKLLLTFK